MDAPAEQLNIAKDVSELIGRYSVVSGLSHVATCVVKYLYQLRPNN